ncbi:MAG: SpoIID/LytB domain-containing protein [Gemmatimonadetes bacterium]|nr:SpoIID/LytB domain-containing protein [Gemmatimonadota bacterium]
MAGCARPPAPPTRLAEMPAIRVGIVVDRDSSALTATGQFRVLGADGAILAVVDAGRTWRAEPGEGADGIRLTRPDRPEPVVVPAPVSVRTERADDHVVINGRRYRGEAVVLRGSIGVTVVNRVPLELYLPSVVALELGFRAPSDREAVMAQAVAARTYAIRYRGRRAALGFDVFPTDADQVYGGVDAELPEVTDATRRTAGWVLTHRGEPIQALFHSTCGWSTEAAEQVFQNREPVPYLRAVSDRFGRGRTDYYCAISPKFRWREEWDGAEINAILAQTLAQTGASANLGRVTNLRVSKTTPTGRAAELVVQTSGGEIAVPLARVREVLRPAPDRQLLSNLFQLHVERRGGELVRVVAAGAGYGHGVGMCQFGAVGRARAGWDFRRILATYYPGTKLERLY